MIAVVTNSEKDHRKTVCRMIYFSDLCTDKEME